MHTMGQLKTPLSEICSVCAMTLDELDDILTSDPNDLDFQELFCCFSRLYEFYFKSQRN